MKASLRAFMKGIIDYAGLFPPADLSLDTSIQKYADYRQDDDAWMLSRFIIPSSNLKDLKPYDQTVFAQNPPFEFSVLGKGTETVSEFYKHLQDIGNSIEQFHEEQGSHVTTDILEVKLPREVVFANDTDLLLDVYKETAQVFDHSNETPNYIFFEAFFEENWKKDIRLVLETMREFNADFKTKNLQYLGFKIRCGGVKADMFPSVEEVAFALNKARENDIAVKCTAGLHHPLRHYADSVQTMMHGFLNVFGGAMLGYAHDLSDEQLTKILQEEDPERFSFTDDGFQWKNLKISTEDIAELREVALISFGSCSFDEPREDLQRLELL